MKRMWFLKDVRSLLRQVVAAWVILPVSVAFFTLISLLLSLLLRNNQVVVIAAGAITVMSLIVVHVLWGQLDYRLRRMGRSLRVDDARPASPAATGGAGRTYQAVKRLLDLAMILSGLILFALIFPVVALLTKLTSRGPVLVTDKRIGRRGRPFRLYKFRTVYEDSQRETPLGAVLCATRMDDLPEIVNVLRGEMSMVGPRPPKPKEVAAYEDWQMERFEVLPGLTGLAQLHSLDCDDADTLLKYDIAYVRRQSLGLDLLIILGTVRTVLGSSAASLVDFAMLGIEPSDLGMDSRPTWPAAFG